MSAPPRCQRSHRNYDGPVTVDRDQLSAEGRLALDNAEANARLEGGHIPGGLVELAEAYAAGDIDAATFEARARAFTARLYNPSQARSG